MHWNVFDDSVSFAPVELVVLVPVFRVFSYMKGKRMVSRGLHSDYSVANGGIRGIQEDDGK